MAEMAGKLEAWGADFLCIACNTAHNYYGAVRDAVRIPVLNMIELTVEAVARQRPQVNALGILASPAVRLTHLYDGPCAEHGIQARFCLARGGTEAPQRHQNRQGRQHRGRRARRSDGDSRPTSKAAGRRRLPWPAPSLASSAVITASLQWMLPTFWQKTLWIRPRVSDPYGLHIANRLHEPATKEYLYESCTVSPPRLRQTAYTSRAPFRLSAKLWAERSTSG